MLCESPVCSPPRFSAFLLSNPSVKFVHGSIQFNWFLFRASVPFLFLLFESFGLMMMVTRDAPWPGALLQLPEHRY